LLCRPDDKFSVSLNETSIAELEALRFNMSDVFSSKNTDTLETEIELEKHIGDDIVKLKLRQKAVGITRIYSLTPTPFSTLSYWAFLTSLLPT